MSALEQDFIQNIVNVHWEDDITFQIQWDAHLDNDVEQMTSGAICVLNRDGDGNIIPPSFQVPVGGTGTPNRMGGFSWSDWRITSTNFKEGGNDGAWFNGLPHDGLPPGAALSGSPVLSPDGGGASSSFTGILYLTDHPPYVVSNAAATGETNASLTVTLMAEALTVLEGCLLNPGGDPDTLEGLQDYGYITGAAEYGEQTCSIEQLTLTYQGMQFKGRFASIVLYNANGISQPSAQVRMRFSSIDQPGFTG